MVKISLTIINNICSLHQLIILSAKFKKNKMKSIQDSTKVDSLLRKEFNKNVSYINTFDREDLFISFRYYRILYRYPIKKAIKLAYLDNGLSQFYFKTSSKNATIEIDTREYKNSLLPTYDKFRDSQFFVAYNRISKIGVKKYCEENNCLNKFHRIHSVLKRNRKYFNSKY